MAVVYALVHFCSNDFVYIIFECRCLVVRSYFIAQTDDLANVAIMQSRAALCELVAMKLLNHFASNRINLVAVLTTAWNPLAGASSEVFSEVKTALGGGDDDVNYPQSALEVFYI